MVRENIIQVFNFFLPYKESVLKGGGLVKSHKKIMCASIRF